MSDWDMYERAHEATLDLAYETGWLRGRIDAVITHLEKDYGSAITLQDKVNVALISLRSTANGDGLAEAIRRNRAMRTLSPEAPKN